MTSERFIYCQLCCIQQSFNLWHAVACKTAKWYGIRETTPCHTFLKTSGVKHITFSNIIKKKGKGFLGGCFLCFHFTFTAETAFENSYEDFTYWKTAVAFFFCSWRWCEYNAFMKLKIRADLRFYKGKKWDLRLGSVNCRAHPVSDIYTSERQKGKKIRFRHMQGKNCFAPSGKGFIGASGNKGMQWAWVSEPLQLQIHLDVDGLDPQPFRCTLGSTEATVSRLTEPTVACWTWGCWEWDWEWGFINCSTSLKRRFLLILTKSVLGSLCICSSATS